jgi:ATP-binding cassette subfamily B protein
MNHNHNLDSSKAKDFKKSMKDFIKYCKPYFIPIIASIIFAFLASFLSIIGPDKLKDITNIITKGLASTIDITAVKKIGLILFIIYLFSAIFNYLEEFTMASVTNKFSKSLRRDITKKINRMPLKYFDKHSYGDILSRITNDVDTLCMALNNSLGTLVSAITFFLGSLFM